MYATDSREACRRHNERTSFEWRKEIAEGQTPIATMLTCSDSRVSPALIFSCGQGDIFVVRNAGNVVDETVLTSIEFGVGHLGTPILLVMGHEKCGAVTAAYNEFCGAPDASHHPHDEPDESKRLYGLLSRIAPSVERVPAGLKGAEAIDAAVKENVNLMADKILETSPLIRRLIAEGKVRFIRAVYMLKDGYVVEI